MEERENGRGSGGLENEREETEKREGERNSRAGKGTSLGVRALARQHTRALVRSLIIFPVAAEGKVAAAGC